MGDGGNPLQIDIGGQRHEPGVDPEDFQAPRLGGRIDRELAIEAPRPAQRRG